jgi:dTDP-4-amino-4,6-dideoxygalactose transaminase
MATRSIDRTPAIEGGRPVRSPDHPFPGVFPRRIDDAALENVRAVLESGFTLDLTSKFEAALAEACGVRHAVAVTNCTAAVHTAIAALNLDPGDEVIVSPISDYGSVAGVVAQGLIPIFPDVDLATGNVTAEEIAKKITLRTRAIVVVHFYGMLCDMDPIRDLAAAHRLFLIEDVCQAPLATYKGRVAGGLADAGCFSFDAEKHLSTDHGGAITTDDAAFAAACRKFALMRGAVSVPGYGRRHETFGLNYRYGNVLAAIGLAQLKILPEQNRRRVALADRLSARIREIPGVQPPQIPAGASHVYWLYHVTFDPSAFRVPVNEIARALSAEGLPGGLAPYYLIPESHTFLNDHAHALGRSDFPFTFRPRSEWPKYGAASVPKAAEHLARTYRFTWTDKLSESDVDDMATIIEKVANYFGR